ncbi:Tau-tubulin kinase 2 [Coelomomyces lativittatus]|nr:Tau-tubulin kinase 2 [Coelomomyces lativittatus]
MPLHGMNLSEIRKQQAGQCFSLSTTALLGRQMVDSLFWVHQLGYLHRDVKPVFKVHS